MKKGRIIKSGKGYKIDYGGKHPMNVPLRYDLTDEHIGKEAQFDNTGGPIKAIYIDGEPIQEKPKTSKDLGRKSNRSANRGQRNYSNSAQREEKPSTGYCGAPYNFIPLNEIIVPAQKKQDAQEHKKQVRHSGYVDYDIRALTPIYIRGQEGDFFGMDGKRLIPGSSIRGMIRTLVEILSYSKLKFTEKDLYLYYRDVGGGKDKYRSRIHNKQKAGWVRQVGQEIEFCPAKRIDNEHNWVSVTGRWNRNRDNWVDNLNLTHRIGSHKEVRFNIRNTHRDKDAVKLTREGGFQGVLYVTGEIGKKKRQYIIGKPDTSKIISLDKSFHKYRDDGNRNNGYDLIQRLEKQKKKGEWLPVFYIEESTDKDDEEAIVIGDTLMFRLPYQNNIAAYLPDGHHNEKIVDLTESIFGSVDQSTKVFFEDANMISGTASEKLETLNVLNSPKPTTYQHYLEPKDGKANTYNHTGQIRGHKLYWHRPGADYLADEDKKKKNQDIFSDPIRKVDAGAIFQGRIRFEQLTDAELGALLLAIDLPAGCAHRIGLGKPYGLGSIRIEQVRLRFIQRAERYAALFENGAWHTGMIDQAEMDKSLADYQFDCIAYINQFLHRPFASIAAFWKDPNRFSHLKSMLTFEPKNEAWLAKTRYMEIEREMREEDGSAVQFKGKVYKDNEYRHRTVLPRPNAYKTKS